MEKPERMKELKNIYVIFGESFINEKIIGTVSSILTGSLPNPEKPIIAYANVEAQNVAKFSARTTEAAIRKGVNLGELMRISCEKCGGNGGGHNIAAGGQVPIEQLATFIEIVNDLAGRQLKGEKIGSNNNSQI